MTTERFWVKVDKTDGCWLWTAYIDGEGYGRFNVKGTPQLAHRFAYVEVVGPIADGLTLDHLCRVRHCVRPDHLEPVTRGENLRRGHHPNFVTVRTGVCKRGHSMEDAYVKGNGRRMCRGCQKERNDARLIPDDDDRHLIGPDVRRDPERGPHRIALRIEDVA